MNEIIIEIGVTMRKRTVWIPRISTFSKIFKIFKKTHKTQRL